MFFDSVGSVIQDFRLIFSKPALGGAEYEQAVVDAARCGTTWRGFEQGEPRCLFTIRFALSLAGLFPSRVARVNGLTTTAMHGMSTLPPCLFSEEEAWKEHHALVIRKQRRRRPTFPVLRGALVLFSCLARYLYRVLDSL